ncbi:MAG: ABC transporter substrate-binding protein [Thermotogota bacterium]|nr:ABC transporter substrate-binding protein [Thermotogota bacterium]
MKKVRFTLMLVAMLSLAGLLFAGGAQEVDEQEGSAKKVEVLRVGMNADSPPFGYMENGELVGMEIDLYKEVAKRMGAELDLTNLPFAGIFPGLQSEKWDVAGNTWIKKERKEMMDFADPWIRATVAFAVKKDSGIKSMEDLKNKVIGVQAGSADHALVEDRMDTYGPYKIKTYDRTVDQLNDLLTGRIDAVARDRTRLLYQIREMPELHVPFDAGNTFMQAAAFRKGDPLRDYFNEIQNEMKKDGTLSKIIEKWLGVAPGPDEPANKIFEEEYEPEA